MTARDFELIAETIRTSELSLVDQAHIAMRFADRLAAANPRFKRAQFLDAAQRDATPEELMSNPNHPGSPIHY